MRSEGAKGTTASEGRNAKHRGLGEVFYDEVDGWAKRWNQPLTGMPVEAATPAAPPAASHRPRFVPPGWTGASPSHRILACSRGS